MQKQMQIIFSFIFANLFVSACALLGGGGGETLNRAKGYDATPPTTWKERSSNSESDRAFKTQTGNIATLTSSCTKRAGAPLDVLTKHLLIGARNIQYEKRQVFNVDSAEGLYSSVKATLDGSPFNLEIFVLPKNSCVFDFSLVSPKPIPQSEKEEFMAFFKSFKYGND